MRTEKLFFQVDRPALLVGNRDAQKISELSVDRDTVRVALGEDVTVGTAHTIDRRGDGDFFHCLGPSRLQLLVGDHDGAVRSTWDVGSGVEDTETVFAVTESSNDIVNTFRAQVMNTGEGSLRGLRK